VLGPEHPLTSETLCDLAVLRRDEGKPGDAEPILKRALAIQETTLGPEHPIVAETLDHLAVLNTSSGELVAAEKLFRRALAIEVKTLGAGHPTVAATREHFASLLRTLTRGAEAEQEESAAKRIRANHATQERAQVGPR
jgi:hypothetical protein